MTHSGDFEEVLDAERERIASRRRQRGVPEDAPSSGVAVSGGGLRSTAFGLGVLRSLAEQDRLSETDYLSTVGGGGFSAAFALWLSRPASSLGGGEGRLVSERALQFVRRSACRLYRLRPGSGPDAPTPMTLPGVLLGRMLLSVLTYGGLLLALFLALDVGDAIVTLGKTALNLASRRHAWRAIVRGLNAGSLFAALTVGAGVLRLILATLGLAARRLFFAVRPLGEQPTGKQSWCGSVWLLLGLITGVLGFVCLYNLFASALAGLGAPLFGVLSLTCLVRCQRAWSSPGTGREPGLASWLLPVIPAMLTVALPVGALLFYIFQSGEAPLGTPVRLGGYQGFVLVSCLIVLLLWRVPKAVRQVLRAFRGVGLRSSERLEERLGLSLARTSSATLVSAALWLLLGSVTWTTRLLEALLKSETVHVYLLGVLIVVGMLWTAQRVITSAQSGRGRHASVRPPRVRGRWLWAATFYALLLFAYGLTHALLGSAFPAGLYVLVTLSLALGALTGANLPGAGRVHRDRLTEAFLPDDRAIKEQAWYPAHDAAEARLSSFGESAALPYLLINTSVATSGSANTARQQRRFDSFTLTPDHCGSESTGWAATTVWQRGRMTLRDAMVTSGQATTPGPEVASSVGQAPGLAHLGLSLLDLTPSYWVDNPDPKACPRPSRFSPRLLSRDVVRQVLGVAPSECGSRVRLSDGGDFDDLGLYELLRRRVRLIIVVDGTDDPLLSLSALGRCLRRAEEDFGVRAHFDDGFREAVGAHGFASAGLDFRDELPAGQLVYLKPALRPGLPFDVAEVATQVPEFPRTASNRLFDEAEFRAYETLGFVTAQAATGQMSGPGISRPAQRTMK